MLGKIEGGRRRGWQRMRCWDGITNSVDMRLSKLQGLVMDREAWHAAYHRVTKSWTWLSDWTELNWWRGKCDIVWKYGPEIKVGSKWRRECQKEETEWRKDKEAGNWDFQWTSLVAYPVNCFGGEVGIYPKTWYQLTTLKLITRGVESLSTHGF